MMVPTMMIRLPSMSTAKRMPLPTWKVRVHVRGRSRETCEEEEADAGLERSWRGSGRGLTLATSEGERSGCNHQGGIKVHPRDGRQGLTLATSRASDPARASLFVAAIGKRTNEKSRMRASPLAWVGVGVGVEWGRG